MRLASQRRTMVQRPHRNPAFLAACVWSLAGCAVDQAASDDAGLLPPDAAPATPDAPPPMPTGPARYPADLVRSPVTASVVEHARAIAARGPTQEDDVLLKTGASGTVSPNFLGCFADPSRVDLDGRTGLDAGIQHFRAGRIGATTPYQRASLAAVVGRTAKWAITGAPSPLDQELAAASPRFAIVDFGANDMGGAGTYPAAVDGFWGNLHALIDRLESQGVIPIVSGLWPRADDPAAAHWVPTFEAATRALAESRQLPYLNLYVATVAIPKQGLVSDGLHGNSYLVDGIPQPCLFTAPALDYHYNVRNLATIEMLDAMRRVVLAGEEAPDPPHLDPVAGEGREAAPFLIDDLPFTHSADTRGGERQRDGYPGCDSGQNESGPERGYRLTLTQPTPLRILVLDRGDVDVDVHLLTGGVCVERNDRVIDRTLPAGDHLIVVDSYVAASGEKAGGYSLVVLRCEAGDPACN
jgi:hypothetical protein